MGMMDRLRAVVLPPPLPFVDNSWPFVNFNGMAYPLQTPVQTLLGSRETISGDFMGLVQGAYKSNGIVFACMLARLSLFSEARFMFRQRRSGTPGDLFSLPSLDILTTPWPNGTTGDLLARAIQDVDLTGNAFFLRQPDRLVHLRPDWTFIIHGSPNDPSADMWDPDSQLLGYGYQPGGPMGGRQPIFYQAGQVAHFAPNPDPIAPFRGMSWLVPLLREIEADSAATSHKLNFFVNGATPNLVVTGVPSASREQYDQWVATFEGKHRGLANAYRSLYLSPTMDAKVVGSNMEQIDFKVTQGAGETRIAAAAGVPASVVGISEGLAGSSLNAGNFAAAMRRFADVTMRPLWRNICGSFATIVPVPLAAELWYDDRDIPALKDDIKDAAEVQQLRAQAIRTLVDTGFTAASVVSAVTAGDFSRLEHTGLFSVQLQAPGSTKMPQGEAPGELPIGGIPGGGPEVPAVMPTTAGAPAKPRSELLEYLALTRSQDVPVVNITPAPISITTPDVHVTYERGAFEVNVEAPAIAELPEDTEGDHDG